VLSNIQSERVNKSNKIFLLIIRSQPGSKGQGLEQVKSYVLIARRQFPIYLIATLTLIITILNFQNSKFSKLDHNCGRILRLLTKFRTVRTIQCAVIAKEYIFQPVFRPPISDFKILGFDDISFIHYRRSL